MRAALAAALALAAAAAVAGPVGATPGMLSVEGGRAVFALPVAPAPGAGDMQLPLSLRVAGPGSPVIAGLSAIRRCPGTFMRDGDARGVFLDSGDHYCLDSQRLVEVSDDEYRTESTG